ncbi:MAG: UxaA family hydrolase [Pseudomonadota bacterium]
MTIDDALLLDELDNVATALRRIEPGESVSIGGPGGSLNIVASEMIPTFHKIAIRSLPAGSDVLKYGDSVGVLIADVEAGALVHIHNLRSNRAVSREP